MNETPTARPAPSYEVVLEPNRDWLRLHWRELWEYRDLLVLLVRRDFVSKYKQTVLGPAWFVLQPVLMTLVFTVVFGHVAEIPTGGIPRVLFYLAGLLGWNYFAQNLAGGATTFSSNAHLFGKVYFPRLIVPLALILSNLFSLALSLATFLAFYVYFHFFVPEAAGVSLGAAALLVPLLVIQTAALSLGVSLWLSACTAKYRDLAHLLPFLVQVWMFASPVIYPLSNIPEKWMWAAWLNPMAAIVESFRVCLLGRGLWSPAHLAGSAALTAVLLLSGLLVFQRTERTVVDTV